MVIKCLLILSIFYILIESVLVVDGINVIILYPSHITIAEREIRLITASCTRQNAQETGSWTPNPQVASYNHPLEKQAHRQGE